jgi:hypothetical protein
MLKTLWLAFAILACAAVAPAAHADSATDVYSVVYTCQTACAVDGGPPVSPNGQYFEPDSGFTVTYDGVEVSVPNPGYQVFVAPTDAFFFIITPVNPNKIDFFIEDENYDYTFDAFINAPAGSLTMEYGNVKFVDQGPAVQNASEPGALGLLALGLGGLAWFGTRRREKLSVI